MMTVMEGDMLRGIVGFNHAEPRDWSADDVARAEQRSETAVVQAEERVRAYTDQSPTPGFCFELSRPATASSSLLNVVGSLGHARLVECSQAFLDEFGSDEDPIEIGMQMRALSGLDELPAALGFARMHTLAARRMHALAAQVETAAGADAASTSDDAHLAAKEAADVEDADATAQAALPLVYRTGDLARVLPSGELQVGA